MLDRRFAIAVMALLATIMIVALVGWVKEITVAMPSNVMVKYNNSLEAVAARTAR